MMLARLNLPALQISLIRCRRYLRRGGDAFLNDWNPANLVNRSCRSGEQKSTQQKSGNDWGSANGRTGAAWVGMQPGTA